MTEQVKDLKVIYEQFKKDISISDDIELNYERLTIKGPRKTVEKIIQPYFKETPGLGEYLLPRQYRIEPKRETVSMWWEPEEVSTEQLRGVFRLQPEAIEAEESLLEGQQELVPGNKLLAWTNLVIPFLVTITLLFSGVPVAFLIGGIYLFFLSSYMNSQQPPVIKSEILRIFMGGSLLWIMVALAYFVFG